MLFNNELFSENINKIVVDGISPESGYTMYDAPEPYQMSFQDPATPIMEGIIDLHHDLFFFLTVVVVFVSFLLAFLIYLFRSNSRNVKKVFSFNAGKYVGPQFMKNMYYTHNTNLEIIWTVIPSVILMFIALPSFALLYAMDEVIHPKLTVKAIGHQWYWSYEYADVHRDSFFAATEQGIELVGYTEYHIYWHYDTYMVPEADLVERQNFYPADKDNLAAEFRLLETNMQIIVPTGEHIRLLVTSTDVLHSWAIPSLGVKI